MFGFRVPIFSRRQARPDCFPFVVKLKGWRFILFKKKKVKLFFEKKKTFLQYLLLVLHRFPLILFFWYCVFVCSTTSLLLVIIQYLSHFVLSIVLCSCCVRGQCQFATCPVFPLFSLTDQLIIAGVISSVLHLDLVINGIHLI